MAITSLPPDVRVGRRTLRLVTGAKIVLRVGATMLATGVFLVAFVAYQLWGTALVEHHAQATLKSELESQVGQDVVGPGSVSATTAPARTTTTSGGPISTTAVPATSTVPTIPTEATPTTLPSTPVPAVYTGFVAPAQADPATGAAVGYLSIPAIGVNEAIVEGVGEAQLQSGPGHYPGTPLPGEGGNAAIAGHRTTYGAPFYELNQLTNGDPIYVQTSQGVFTYEVTGSQVVAPNNVSVLDPSPQPALTLTTCNPRYSATSRLVVKAALVSSRAAASGGGGGATPTSQSNPSPRRPSSLAGSEALAGHGQGVVVAVLWGVVMIACAIAAIVVVRRRTWLKVVRWGGGVVGALSTLGAMLLFFEHVSTVLPGSF